jgi:hypothetical protein
VHHDHGIVVDVDDAALGRDALRDLVGVVGGGQPGADVQELPDARLAGQVARRPPQEVAVLQRGQPGGREALENLVPGGAIDREVVLAAEPVVVSAGGVPPKWIRRSS